MNPTEAVKTVDIRDVKGPLVKEELVPQYIKDDLGQTGLEGFERYWRECCSDPEKMRLHEQMKADYRRRRAAREAARRAQEGG